MDKWAGVHRNIDISDTVDWILKDHPWSGSRNFTEMLKIYGGVSGHSHIMDAGCATGKIGLATAMRTGCELTCLDYSEEGILLAKKVYQELLVRAGKEIPDAHFVRADIQDLPYKDQFDVVFNEGVIEHWQEREKRLNAIVQMLKSTRPAGVVLIWVPNKRNPLYWFYKRRGYYRPEVEEWLFTAEELSELMAEAGLRKVKVLGFQPYLSPFYLSPKFIRRLRALGILFWLISWIMPSRLREVLSIRFSFEIVGIGRKPNNGDIQRRD